jgi:predicted CopG family antitoxin
MANLRSLINTIDVSNVSNNESINDSNNESINDSNNEPRNNNMNKIMNKLSSEPLRLKVKWNDTQYYIVKYSDEHSDKTNPIVNDSNCVFFEQGTNKIVHYSYPRIRDLSMMIVESDDSLLDMNKYIIRKYYDGTIIKLFYSEDKWNVATNYCINATKSKFDNNKNFYEMFVETAEKVNFDIEQLDKTKAYTYLVIHPENKIVVTYTQYKLVLLAEVELETLTDETLNVNPEDEDIVKCDNYQTLINMIEEMNNNLKESISLTDKNVFGYLAINRETGVRYKIESDLYKSLKSLRGSKENIRYRYLELRKDNNIDIYLKYYGTPEMEQIFKEISLSMNGISNILHQLYIEMYVKKIEYTDLDKKYKTALYLLHKEYQETREKRTKKNVRTFFGNMQVMYQAKLLNIKATN